MCGTIPFGLWAARFSSSGVDIRQKGSQNIGATNVLRCVGKGAAAFTLMGDSAKGFIPVALSSFYDLSLTPFLVLCVTLGHVFPVNQNFKGGKGIATACGALLAVSWEATLILLVFWVLLLFCTRIVSVASIVTSWATPIVFWVTHEQGIPVISFLSLLLTWTHRENIKRLWNGCEPTVYRKKT